MRDSLDEEVPTQYFLEVIRIWSPYPDPESVIVGQDSLCRMSSLSALSVCNYLDLDI